MSELIFGVMTGTSMDAIDVCLLEVEDGKPVRSKDFYSKPISKNLRNTFLSLLTDGQNELERSNLASIELSLNIAQIVNSILKRNNLTPKKVLGIGVHGQTIRHNPEKLFTVQLCNPSIISEKTKLTVVSDFRTKDIVAGGQGAPLAPLFHKEISKNCAPCVILNIGGIANITVIKKNNDDISIEKAFDTGPGNCLLDLWCKKNFDKPYDNKGSLAKEGILNNKLLKNMFSDPYFSKNSPKSTGLNYFNEDWINIKLRNFKNQIDKKNTQTTLTELTALSIAKNIPKDCFTIYVCGGGAKNFYLVERIESITQCKVLSTYEIGWDPQIIEAACFAWLALKALNNERLDLRTITGSKRPTILGNITFY